MSRVYLATDRALGREVVVKTLPSDIMSQDAVERFKREIRTAAALQHPNIVPLLTAGDADGMPYYTMPWVDGASLRERIQRGPVPLDDAIAILRDMARALAAAHAKGVVHRDIKPENVLLSSGAALVTDFGVARALSAATTEGVAGGFRTATGIAVGTPAYMAPEQFAADPSVDHRADLYAWGVVAYEVLTGHHPFEGASGSALLKAHLSSTPRPVTDFAPTVPTHVTQIVARCLEKDPAKRPMGAEDLVEALGAAVSGRTMAASGMRRRGSVGIAVTVLVLAAAAGALVRSRTKAAAGDERKIAVAPFRVGGAAPTVHYLREGLGDLMTPQLHAIPGVTAPSMRVMLEQWRRAGGSVDADLPDDRALRVAGGAGAGQLILGEIVGTEKHLTINAQLVRVSDGHVLAPAKVEGPADSAAALAGRLLATLLAIRDGATVDRVRSVVSANPEAITPFLIGEQAYRRGRYGDASRAFATAFQHDSTFAIAALRLWLTNGWTLSSTASVPGPWLDRAWQNRQHLSGSDAALLDAVTGPTYPRPRPARQYERDLRSAAERTNSAELWYQVGDVMYHRFRLSGDSTYPRRALDAFRRAEAIDSSFVPALEHQSALYAFFGDSANERAAWLRQRMLDSTGDFFQATNAVFRAKSGTVQQALDLIQQSRKGREGLLLLAANVLTFDLAGTRRPDSEVLGVGDAFARAFDTVQPGATSGDPSLAIEGVAYWINTGRPRPFQIGSARDSALFVNVLNTLAGLLWDGDTAAAVRSAGELARWSGASKDTMFNLARSSAYFAHGLWALSHGDTAAVERARARLRALRVRSTTPWVAVTPEIHEKLLGAHIAVARKAPDVRARLEELDSLLIDAPVHRNLVANVGNLVVSRLWEAAGDDRRAWNAVNRQHMHIGGDGFSTSRLKARARIAQRLGMRNEAIEALKVFVLLRAKADPRFQPEVAEARATLAKLETQSTGR
jgi:serine/threonine-protein kinase